MDNIIDKFRSLRHSGTKQVPVRGDVPEIRVFGDAGQLATGDRIAGKAAGRHEQGAARLSGSRDANIGDLRSHQAVVDGG